MSLALSSSSSPFFAASLKSKTICYYRTNSCTRSPVPIAVAASTSPSPRPSPLPPLKIVRLPALDRHAAKHSRLRFARKLKTLLLSKPKHFLSLRVLSRCRAYLNPPPRRSLLSMIQRYPALFSVFHAPSQNSTSLSFLAVTLTPGAALLAAEESRLRDRIANDLAAKVQRLLMLAPHRRLLLSKLSHLAPDLGLGADFRSSICNAHPSRFRTVDTSYGRALELVSWNSSLAEPFPRLNLARDEDPLRRPIIDRPPKFPQLRLPRGLNLRRCNREYLVRFQELPEVNPYGCSKGGTVELEEKRACAVVREVLGMTTEKRTLVDHLTHFRKDLGLPNRLRAMLVRHPEMFYVSVKGVRHSVYLVEAYDDKGKLMVVDELNSIKENLAMLVREGKRMRRERRRGVGYGEQDDFDDDDEEVDDDDDDVLDNLLDTGIGDDWEELEEEGGCAVGEVMEMGELWVSSPLSSEGGSEGGSQPEAW